MTKVYSPYDDPLHINYGGKEYILAPNADGELPDDVAEHAMVRHAETGLRLLSGSEGADADIRKVAEEQFALFLKRQLAGPRGLSQHLVGAAVKRGLLGSLPDPPAEPEPEPKPKPKGRF